MAIDPRLSLAATTPDLLGAAQSGQEMAINAANAPVNLQGKLTELERNKLRLADESRVNAFKDWLKTNPPVLDAQGKIDVTQTARNMFEAGHGQFGLGMMADALSTNTSIASNQQDIFNAVKGTAVQLSQATANLPPDQKASIAKKSSEFIKQKYGVSPDELFGTTNWLDVAKSAPTTELQASGERRADITNLTTKEDLSPSSNKSKDFRKFVQDQFGVELPASLSIGDASRDPLYKNQVESFMIGQGARTSAVGGVAETQTQKTALSNLYNAMSTGELTSASWWKPAEKIVNIFKSITNNEDRAKLTQIINEAKTLGIEIDENTTLAGARDAIQRQIGTVSTKQAGQKAIATSGGVKSATERSGGGGAGSYVAKNGKIYNLTADDLNNPAVQKLFSTGVLRK